jgi:hypothetical protein
MMLMLWLVLMVLVLVLWFDFRHRRFGDRGLSGVHGGVRDVGAQLGWGKKGREIRRVRVEKR